MVVGVCVWQLEVIGCQSLKEKRSVVKSLKDRLHQRFNVSAAETNHQDLWQRAELSVCVVATDGAQADAVLRSAEELVHREHRVRVIHAQRAFH